jgi:hypothetical protein
MSDDESPEGVSFSVSAAAAAADAAARGAAASSKRRRSKLPRLTIAPVPVSAEMLEALAQQQAAPTEDSGQEPDADAETPEERLRRLRRQKRARQAQQAAREQSIPPVRRETR